MKMKNEQNKIRRHAASMLYIIASVIALLLFAASTIYCIFFKGDSKTGTISPFEKQKLNRTIETTTAEYQRENEKAFQELNNVIQNAGKGKFNQARKNVRGTVKEFSKFKVCGKLTYKMAKDRIRKTNDTRTAICSVVGPNIIKPCQEGHAEMMNALRNYLHTLQENDNRYRAKLAQALKEIPGDVKQSEARNEFLNKTVLEFERQVNEMAISQVTTAVGAVIEVVLIKETVKLITKVGAKAVARIIGSASAGAVCAVADGPLPIGDLFGAVITVGGFAWGAYDIYKICKVLPKKMSSTLHSAINQYEKASREEVLATAVKALNDAKTTSNALSDQLKKM